VPPVAGAVLPAVPVEGVSMGVVPFSAAGAPAAALLLLPGMVPGKEETGAGPLGAVLPAEPPAGVSTGLVPFSAGGVVWAQAMPAVRKNAAEVSQILRMNVSFFQICL
jgi:uncharacterized protein with LGFP repeats